MKRPGFLSAIALGSAALLAALGPAPPALAGDEAHVGKWEGPFCWPVQGTHMIHLHTGQMLIFPGHYDSSDSIEAWLWEIEPGCFGDNPRGAADPDCFTRVDNDESNLFCSGHAQLADGRVLITGGHHPPFGAHVGLPDANLFDPVTGSWTGGDAGVAEMSFRRWYPTSTTLPDGRVLTVSGSNRRCHLGDHHGENCIRHADCADDHGSCDEGTCDAGIHAGASCERNADCLNQNGTCDLIEISAVPEIFDPGSDTWSTVPEAPLAMPFYPLMFVLPDGRVFYAGAEDDYNDEYPAVSTLDNRILDLEDTPPSWTFVDASSVPGGSGVMYEPGKILKAGGFFDPATDGAQVIDLTAGGAKSWQDVESMVAGRIRNNLTLLPDGTVLATGGTRRGNLEYERFCVGGERDGLECHVPGFPPGDPGFHCPATDEPEPPDDGCGDGGTCTGGDGTQRWVAEAEIFDPSAPAGDEWTVMASMKTPRLYHSSAVLLPDGRVIKAGGGQGGFGIHDYHTFEIFYPPYLFKGTKPSVSAVPEAVRYGDVFEVATPDAAGIVRASLVRLAAVTHGFDQNQRYVPLAFTPEAGKLLVTGALVGGVERPLDPCVAPPGYYMLFVLNAAGVPSVGEYVRLTSEPLPLGVGGTCPKTVVWVDFDHAGPEEGTFPRPFDTLAEGVAAVTAGGVVRIKSGTTPEIATITKPLTLESFGGEATIGEP